MDSRCHWERVNAVERVIYEMTLVEDAALLALCRLQHIGDSLAPRWGVVSQMRWLYDALIFHILKT